MDLVVVLASITYLMMSEIDFCIVIGGSRPQVVASTSTDLINNVGKDCYSQCLTTHYKNVKNPFQCYVRKISKYFYQKKKKKKGKFIEF